MLLSDLDADVLTHLFLHTDCPFALKLTCSALRVAGPARTKTPHRVVVVSVPRVQWAIANGCCTS